ncbi:MAG: CpsD/CapB family tyrosine-protein kinase [Nitrospirales bacterium]|nr:CpsD/CapB family tyrosine-protein kinase [Nitrospirales bacterium]
MSKIYDALQIAYEERLGTTKNINQPVSVESTQPPVPASTSPSASALVQFKPSASLQRFHKENDLLLLAQNIAALLPGPDKNVIQFIGSRKGEGTSTLVREFAMVAAQHSTKPVLLVEADLINPSQYQAFGIPAKPPLDHVLKEGKAIEGVASQVDKSNLFLATLSSKTQSALTDRTFLRPTEMWELVRDQFSLILIDSSPASITSDSLALCESVDGIVLVVEAEKTRAVVAKNVKDLILMREGNLLGMVFTKRKLHIPECLYKYL